MSKLLLLLTLSILFYATVNVFASHFRGGVIMVRPKLGGAEREMEISYQFSWRRSHYSSRCNSSLIANNYLFNSTNNKIECLYGCSGDIISQISYFCTYFNFEDDWAFGEYHLIHNFDNVSDENTITIGTSDGTWIKDLDKGLWNVSTTFSLVTRADTGKINSSPRILPTLPLRLQKGCNYIIPLPISDLDNDTVRCRWAKHRECRHICRKFPGAVLDSTTCTINYNANKKIGIKPVAIMIEDYAPGSPNHPLSSVALQFLVLVYKSNQPCSTQIECFRFPTIILHPLSVLVHLHKSSVNLTLTCMANETSSYHWERQNGEIPKTSIGINTDTLTLIDVQPENAGRYRCVAYVCNIYNQNFSDYATITVNVSQPVIVLHPSSSYINLTQNATFTCNATGYNVSYQWTIGSGSFPSKVTDINSNTLVIPDVRLSDDNTYTCMASNEGGSAFSETAKLIVTVNLPVITKNPSSTLLNLRSNFTNVSFTCEAYGASSYYWERQHNSIPATARGVNRSTLTIISLQLKDAGYYRCVATNANGSSNSKYARLTLNAALSNITTQPTDTSAAAPFSGVFTCSVTGNGYQNITWYKQSGTLPYKHKTKEVTSGGVITSTLIIPNVTKEDVGKYYCQVWANNIGVRSKEASLHYSGTPIKPTVTILPSQLIKLEVNNFMLKMRCLPYNSNFSYRWERKNKQLPSNAVHISSEQLTIINLKPEDSGEYRCIMSNSTGQIASDYSRVIVKVALPTIISQPSSIVTEVYDVAIFECIARSYGSVSITWQRLNSKLPKAANVTVAKSLNEVRSILRIEKSIGYYKGYYYCVIKNRAGVVNSTVAYCNVTVPCPQIIIAPQPDVVRPSAAVTFSCLAWSYGGLVYKWNRNSSSNLPSNATISYQEKPFPADTVCFTTVYELKIINVHVRDEGLYCCIASNECGSSKICAWLEVNTSPQITMQPKSQSFKNKRKNIAALWIVATAIGPIYYQWKRYDPLTNRWISPSSRAENITSPNLTFSVITEEDQGLYHCIASNDDGSVLSHGANITVYDSPNITYHTNAVVIFEGNKVNMVCNATNDRDAIDPVQISWYNGTKLLKSDGKHIIIYNEYYAVTDQIHSILTLDRVNYTNDGKYTCRAYNNPLCYTENKITLTVEYAPRIAINPSQSPHIIPVGERLFLYCMAEGFPIPTIQWYVNNTSTPLQSSPLYLASSDAPGTTVYTCEGRNNAGNMENVAHANVTVIVKKTNGCPKLGDPDNGSVFLLSPGVAIFTCKSNFTTIGDSYLRCIDEKWSSPPPKCQPL